MVQHDYRPEVLRPVVPGIPSRLLERGARMNDVIAKENGWWIGYCLCGWETIAYYRRWEAELHLDEHRSENHSN